MRKDGANRKSSVDYLFLGNFPDMHRNYEKSSAAR